VTAERPEWVGWLPDAVQVVSNAAARAGLIPVVTADAEAIDLYAPGPDDEDGNPTEVSVGCVGLIGEEVWAFLAETVQDEEDRRFGDCLEVAGLDAVLAWVAGAVDTAPARA
jgi:hypothetical protein